jgi:spore coat protein H
LRVEKYRKILDEKINELHALLTPDLIRQILMVYQPIVKEYIRKMPDLFHLRGTPADHSLVYSYIPTEIQLNYELYKASIEKPMPFYLGTPEVIEDKIKFNWEEAYDLNAQNINYRFQVSTRLEFTNLVVDQATTNITSIQIPKLKPGAYFWRVSAINVDGHTQYAFDSYIDTNGIRHPGIKYFYIDSQGKVLEQPAQ